MTGKLTVEWIDSGRETECPPNPKHPNGIDVILGKVGSPTCFKELPYPAKRCGLFLIHCSTCGASAAITAAGRPDDPRSVRLSCKLES